MLFASVVLLAGVAGVSKIDKAAVIMELRVGGVWGGGRITGIKQINKLKVRRIRISPRKQ